MSWLLVLFFIVTCYSLSVWCKVGGCTIPMGCKPLQIKLWLCRELVESESVCGCVGSVCLLSLCLLHGFFAVLTLTHVKKEWTTTTTTTTMHVMGRLISSCDPPCACPSFVCSWQPPLQPLFPAAIIEERGEIMHNTETLCWVSTRRCQSKRGEGGMHGGSHKRPRLPPLPFCGRPRCGFSLPRTCTALFLR